MSLFVFIFSLVKKLSFGETFVITSAVSVDEITRNEYISEN